MAKKVIISFYLICVLSFANAQGDITLYSMRELYQSTYLNPAFISTYNQSNGVPALSNIGVAFQLTGFNLGNVLNNVASDGFFNFTNFYHDANDGIGIKLNVQTDLFHHCKQFGHYQIGLNLSIKNSNEIYFSKDFIGFLAEGNAKYAGQNISFTGTRMNITAYTETGLSIAREFNKFSIGARVKMLNGIANISTNTLNLNYHTSSNSFDPTTVSLAGTINSSGYPESSNTSFYPGDIANKLFNNLGWAFDFGATYSVTPRLTFTASAIDIGFINWKNDVNGGDVNNTIISFPGFNLLQTQDGNVRQKYTDSLQNLVKSGTSKNPYTTMLPSRFMFSSDYDLTLRDRVGFLYQLQYFYNSYYSSYTFNYSRKIGTNWRITTNYGYYNNSFTNLGIGTSVKCGAFQIYLMQDDILFYFFPSTTRTIYLRFGCNLVWGENKTRTRF